MVEGGRPGAVDREPGAGAVQHDVAGRVARAEHDVARRPRDGLLDQLARQAGDHALVVDLGPGVAQDPERAATGEAHPAPGQHVERRGVDRGAGGLIEQAQVGDHGIPFAFALLQGTMTRKAPGAMRQSIGSLPAGSPSVCTRTSPVSPGATVRRAASVRK
jgi:hypothetical protein